MQKINESTIRDLLQKHDVEFTEQSMTNGRQLRLKHCVFDSNHTNGDAKILLWENGRIDYKCHHDTCKNKRLPDFIKKLEPDFYKDGKPEKKVIKEEKGVRKIRPAISATELLGKEIPPIQWVVKDLLPVGLAVLAAPPKSYKSFWCLDLLLSVSAGRPFLGFPTEKSICLYLDLESSERRPRDRIRQIIKDDSVQDTDNLRIFATSTDGKPEEEHFDYIGEGFEEQLQEKINENPGVKLVVIDVLQKIKPSAKRGQTAYEADYSTLAGLSEIARRNNICILLVHHTKKAADPSDWQNNLSGSTAMSGAMDTILLINRDNRTDDDATLYASGRDIKPQELAIRWDPAAFRWRLLGTAKAVQAARELEEYNASPVVATIKGLAKAFPEGWSGTIQDIITQSKWYKQIYSEQRMVGKEISRFNMYLSFDGVMIEKRKTSRANVYDISLSDFSETQEEYPMEEKE